MRILITNDDGYYARGIESLARIMKSFGDVTVLAPKTHQSGMGMSVSIGTRPIAYKDMGVHEGIKWSYLDATPASCVKFGLNHLFLDADVVLCGINHGSNASTAACYSGTLGAAAEASLNGVPGIGVSLDTIRPDADFSGCEKWFPQIFEELYANLSSKYGVYYNINFPNIAPDKIKGVRVGEMGLGRWVREFTDWNPVLYERFGITEEYFRNKIESTAEPGEKMYMMVGNYIDSPSNTELSDNILVNNGYISVVAHNLVSGDREENARLRSLNKLDKDF